MPAESPFERMDDVADELLDRGICPDCFAHFLIMGPRGGAARNVLCGGCLNEFTTGPMSTRVNHPCPLERVIEVYQLSIVEPLKWRSQERKFYVWSSPMIPK